MALSEHLEALGDTIRPGDRVESVASSRRMNAIIGAIRALARGENILGGPGVRVKTLSASGVALIGSVQGRAGEEFTHPFKITDASSNDVAKVKIRKGSVNDVIPMGVEPASQTLTSAGVWYVYLDCTLSDDAAGSIVAVDVVVAISPQPADTRTHAYVTLATATAVATEHGLSVGEVAQLATHSLRFSTCGRTEPTEENPEPEDGSYNFWGF